jgi:hypothetical protein
VLTTFAFCVQLTKLWVPFGVAVTVTELPSVNVPAPLTVP